MSLSKIAKSNLKSLYYVILNLKDIQLSEDKTLRNVSIKFRITPPETKSQWPRSIDS